MWEREKSEALLSRYLEETVFLLLIFNQLLHNECMAVSLYELEKALRSLEQVLLLPKDDVVRDAAIQRFEFCVELSWKTAKKTMGTVTSAPKQVIREMAQNGYISSVEPWFEALEARNLSSHTYDEVLAEKVFSVASKFPVLVRHLLSRLPKES